MTFSSNNIFGNKEDPLVKIVNTILEKEEKEKKQQKDAIGGQPSEVIVNPEIDSDGMVHQDVTGEALPPTVQP